MEIQPYIFFNGRCEEAIAFYSEALGAVELMKMHFSDAPPDPAQPVPADLANRIMHATLVIGKTHVLMSDGDGQTGKTHAGFSLSVTADDVPSGEKYFSALSKGGQVTMAFGETFWTPGFGMLVDRFGVSWMVNVKHDDQPL
jgi:PhnB protein